MVVLEAEVNAPVHEFLNLSLFVFTPIIGRAAVLGYDMEKCETTIRLVEISVEIILVEEYFMQ